MSETAINYRPEIHNLLVRLRDRRRMEWTFDMDKAADEIERLTSENDRMRSALAAVHRYDEGLRASNWPGLADVVRDALHPDHNGSSTDLTDESGKSGKNGS